MLSLVHGDGRTGRRAFLRAGTLGLGGLTLADLLAAKAGAAEAGAENGAASVAATAGTPGRRKGVRDRSVIFLFQHGGPTQFETFDPKPDAPSEFRSVTGHRPTALPGVAFGGTMNRLAALADKFAVVRSFVTGNGNHDIKPIVCADTLDANLGSLVARVAGANHPATGMPTNVALFPQSVDPEAGPAQSGFGKFDSTGKLGAAFAPFTPGGKGELQNDMRLALAAERFADRQYLLSRIDDARRSVDRMGIPGDGDRFREQAYQVLLGGMASAFDLKKEDPRLVARYDTAPLLDPAKISDKWKNRKHYTDNVRTLGRLLLTARRLCEAGAGFVTVTTNFVWDFHADGNNAPCDVGMKYVGDPFDHAVSAFVEDCEARGLRDRILLVCCGEMGRTPRLNKGGGRDHWGNLAPLMLYGGGLRMGQVVGQSSSNGGEPNSDPVGIRNLVATILHTVFDMGEIRVTQGLPVELNREMQDWSPIRELTG